MSASTEYTVVSNNAQSHGYEHGTHANRIDIVEMGTFKFYMRWAQPQWFIDHQIRDHGTNPGESDNAEYTQRFFEGAINTYFHQDNRHYYIKYDPDHAPRMSMGKTGEKV